MSCQKFESVISDLAREQMMETGVRGDALAHCDRCPECAKRLDEQRALTGALRALAQKMESVQTPEALPEVLTMAMRSLPAQAPPAARDYHLRYWLTAVAAALLIFFAMGAVLIRQRAAEGNVDSTSKVANASEQPTPAIKTPTPVPAAEKEKPKPRRNRSNSERKPVRPNDREAIALKSGAAKSATTAFNSEIATEFMPLGYGDGLNLQEGGQIVRVEMPRSTLASFGLPVNMNRASERVKADLLVGIDGSARAIRFVQ